MSRKYTPAPWHTCEHSWSDTSIFNEGCKKLIAKLSIYNYATEENQQELEAEMDANARLIATAPDLLWCLNEVMSAIPSRRDWLDPDLEKIIIGVIAKAEGDTPK